MELDFAGYIQSRKTGASGERGEGYAYEGDLKVLRTMRAMRPVEIAVAQTVKLFKSFLKHDLLGSAVKVGPTQFARVHRITQECAQALGIAAPTVYVVPQVTINAMTYGTDDDAFIMVHSATIDYLSDDELKFVIGHECGHIQNNHVVYLTTLAVLMRFTQNLAGVLFAPLIIPATLALQSWSRAAEITSDRAGLLCGRDPATAMRSFVKLAVGNKTLFNEINIDAYLDQFNEGREGVGRVSELNRSHPYLPKRIEALRVFAESELYRTATGAPGGISRDELETRTLEIVKVL